MDSKEPSSNSPRELNDLQSSSKMLVVFLACMLASTKEKWQVLLECLCQKYWNRLNQFKRSLAKEDLGQFQIREKWRKELRLDDVVEAMTIIGEEAVAWFWGWRLAGFKLGGMFTPKDLRLMLESAAKFGNVLLVKKIVQLAKIDSEDGLNAARMSAYASRRGKGVENFLASFSNLPKVSLKMACKAGVVEAVKKKVAEGVQEDDLKGTLKLKLKLSDEIEQIVSGLAALRTLNVRELVIDVCEGRNLRILRELVKASPVLDLSGLRLPGHSWRMIAQVAEGLFVSKLIARRSIAHDDSGISVLVAKLENLEHLDLSYCYQISDYAITTVALNCRKLKNLNIFGCSQVTDSSINDLSMYCTGLTSLNIGKCWKITDASLECLSENCAMLADLNISGCRMSDEAIKSFVEQKSGHLKSLSLKDIEGVRESTVESLARNHKDTLKHLDVRCCICVTEGVVDTISANCTNLTSLKLRNFNHRILDDAIETLARNCVHLTSLNLRCCKKITDKSINALVEHCKKLKSLNLRGCEDISGDALARLTKECEISSLNLQFCTNLTDLQIEYVSRPELRKLNLRYCVQLSEKSLRSLERNCRQLTSLDLGRCSWVTDDSLIKLTRSCTNLKSLDLSKCEKVTDKALQVLPVCCTGMTSLDLSGCDSITNSSIECLAVHCHDLRHLNLELCTKITDNALKFLATYSIHCRSLNFNYCWEISDIGVISLSQALKLSTMSLRSCKKISDHGLKAISKMEHHLVSLDLSGCDFAEKSLKDLIGSCRFLTKLNLSDLDNVTDGTLQWLSEKCPDLSKLDLMNCRNVTTQGTQHLTEKCKYLSELRSNSQNIEERPLSELNPFVLAVRK